MARLDEARSLLKQYDELITILNSFYWDSDFDHVMYFTEEESATLAEYLINHGIIISKYKEN